MSNKNNECKYMVKTTLNYAFCLSEQTETSKRHYNLPNINNLFHNNLKC